MRKSNIPQAIDRSKPRSLPAENTTATAVMTEDNKPAEKNAPPKKKKASLAKRIKYASKAAKNSKKNPDGTKKENKSKPKDFKKSFKRLLGYLKAKKWVLVLVAVLIILSKAVSTLSLICTEKIVNLARGVIDASVKPLKTDFMKEILMWQGIMIGMSVISAVFDLIQQRIMMGVSQKTVKSLRTDLFNHIQTLPLKYFDTNKRGDIMSRFNNDTSSIESVIGDGYASLVNSIFGFGFNLAMMIYYSWRITSMLFISLVVMVVLVIVVGAACAVRYKNYRKTIGESTAHVEEYIHGQRVVKIFNREEINKKQYADLAARIRREGIGVNTISGILVPVMNFISKINYAVCCIMGAAMIIRGEGNMDLGRLVVFLSLASSFASPLTTMGSLYTSWMSALAGAERVFEVIDMPSEPNEGTVIKVKAVKNEDGTFTECDDYGWKYYWKYPVTPEEYEYIPIKGEVEFKDVTFGYNEEKTVLKHISLKAESSKTIAFVGSTGAGKTTITNLINRFYDINEGTITVDSVPIRSIKKEDLRSVLSMVLQDTHLFSGTVADNIRYGRMDATQEDIERAAVVANAHSFISRLPDGYDTMIKGDGQNLSQGQRQLIAIARAAVADSYILILDEATSSIDTRTEKLIEEGMSKIMQGRTVFVIAHRLSTVRNSDDIKVLEAGEIIESGSHEQLLEKEGKYYQLYNGLYELT